MNLTKQNNQVLLLYSSSIVGLLLGVINSVINTRALAPELYGDVRYVQNLISFISSLLLLGYFVSGSRLLALSKDEKYSKELRGIMCLILAITIGIVMISMVILFLVNRQKGDSDMAVMFLASVPVCGNVLMLNYINTVSQGDNHIGRIALARLLPAVSYAVLSFVIYKYVEVTPVVMLLLFNGISVLSLLFVILSTGPSFKNLKESFIILNDENRQYGLNVYMGSLVNVSTSYLSGITLSWFCDNNVAVGFFTLSVTLSMPLSMLPAIVGTTHFKEFASQNCIDNKVFSSTFALTLLSFLLYIAFIGIIVRFLYDDSYSCVSRYASLLAISTSIHGIADMINRFLGAHGQGKMLRNSAFISGSITILGSLVLVYFWHINGAIITRILSSFAYLATMFVFYYKFKKSNEI